MNLSRRSFVSGGIAAVAAARPRRVLGANDRIRVGVIGSGSNAEEHLKALIGLADQDNVEIAAVCDVYQPRLDRSAAIALARPYKDYRALLEHRGLDYVVISSPNHWHAQMAIDAIDAGLHVYCEKPLAHTISECLEVRRKVRESKSLLQCGVQGMSDDSYEAAARYIREGAIGKPILAQVDYSRNYVDDLWLERHDPGADPNSNLDWDAFLGQAPRRPWEPDRFFSWRRYWDYSGGIPTDLLVHRLTLVIKACGLTAPSRVVATGGKYVFKDSAAEVPDAFNAMLEYPEGMTVLLTSTMANSSPVRHTIRGHHATLEFTDDGFEIKPEESFSDRASSISYRRTGGESIALHHHNLHEAIRDGAPLNCDIDLGLNSSLACLIAVESFRTRKYLAWDPVAERVVEAA
ncbi:MAG: Gfo/Idh/MocA family oxidoreductase [Acidobacteria bacterium]|nr:Gfo/Idh/MocA family oxidoreductase [Acidobacteriota bacterium]MDA1234267.1 Gfo/Idh/MocA family oxidoreductase [Acidobacteriota bacterium]